MKIFHVSAECYPVAKVGGLADVVGALPKYQNKLGTDSSVFMPWYTRPFTQSHSFANVFDGVIVLRDLYYNFQILKEENSVLGFDLYLIRIEGLLDRENPYGYWDAALQFIGFQQVFLFYMRETGNIPDIVHCHDHHTGLIPFMLKYCFEFQSLRNLITIGTIHNGEYQGQMSWEMANFLPQFDRYFGGMLDWGGIINPLAALIKCCNVYTTVSEGYLNELYYKAGGGLESLFRQEMGKSYGIVNGIDIEIWNPETDEMLPFKYNVDNFYLKKSENKSLLYEQYNLNENLPLVSFIGRFATEKGADLVPSIIERMINERNGDVNFFVLGSGNTNLENWFRDLQYRYRGNFGLELGYNESLSHLIYASSDYILMPSRVEPCGLNQLYSMAYGTIPIVRRTGGLNDTVPDISEENGRGFAYNDADINGACWAIHRALNFEFEKEQALELRKKIMNIDFSWEKSAQKYLNLYKSLKTN